MEVNGTDLTGKSQDEVVGLLRGIPYNTEVVLVVGRPETTSPIIPSEFERPTEPLYTENKEEALAKNKEVLTFDIPLNDTGSAGLGVRVKGKATTVDGENKDQGIFVMNVITGGAASKVYFIRFFILYSRTSRALFSLKKLRFQVGRYSAFCNG